MREDCFQTMTFPRDHNIFVRLFLHEKLSFNQILLDFET